MDPTTSKSHPIIIVGGGFAGLTAALRLCKQGKTVLVLEKDADVGGLGGGFKVGNQTLEKFYHHWFTNDTHIMDLIHELKLEDNILLRPTRTGMYYSDQFYRLSTPLDLLKFKALPFIERIRLGLGVLRARAVKDWKSLEDKTAREWLLGIFGPKVFAVVWEPLLIGKFGDVANEISAVWFWKKLVLRGGSRGSSGDEMLAYYRGGFTELAYQLRDAVVAHGGQVITNAEAVELTVEDGKANGVRLGNGEILPASHVVFTTPLPVTATILGDKVPDDYLRKLQRIRYLSNVCLVLSLDRSLSDTYWLNVNDANFPFVGIIEHTNFEPPASYEGRHIVYLSKYLPATEKMYQMSDDELVDFSVPHIRKMFPEFRREWIQEAYVWRADYTQPIVEKNYSRLIPDNRTPLPNVFITSMAQIYPEDRGTNYAVREGNTIAGLVLAADA